MGVQAVFRAYQRRLRECGKPDPALPGLEKYDNNQTFFLAFANVSLPTVSHWNIDFQIEGYQLVGQ